MHQATPTRRRTDAPVWPFAPLTEAQEAARRAQECAMRREAARTQHHRLQRARAALAAAGACIALAACGGGGDDPNATDTSTTTREPIGRVPTPVIKCQADATGACI